MNTAIVVGLASVMLAAQPPADVTRLHPITIPAHSSSFAAKADLSPARARILAAAETSAIVLDLDGIEAERSPAVYFEVYVHAAGMPRGESVGNLALFGTGIRSETAGEFRPAHVRLTVTAPLRAALRRSSVVALTFVAQGAGGVAAPRSAAAVQIRKPAIVIERAASISSSRSPAAAESSARPDRRR